jgi:adenylate kinase
MYREAAAAGTKLGKRARPFMERGELVPDDITNQMVRDRLERPDMADGFVLDGYPRNLIQAEYLDRVLDEMGTKLDRVVKFMITGQIIAARVSARRVCPTCKTVYHLEAKPPKDDELCDNDGTPLIHRKDDTPEAVETRLETYGAETKPLYDLYSERGILVDVDALGSQDEVFQRLLEAVNA